MVKGQAWGTAPLPTADHRGGGQVKKVLHPCKGSHRIISHDGASDLNTEYWWIRVVVLDSMQASLTSLTSRRVCLFVAFFGQNKKERKKL